MFDSIFGKLLAKPRGYRAGEVVKIFIEGGRKKVKVRWTKYDTRFHPPEKVFYAEQIEAFYKSSTPFTRWLKKLFHSPKGKRQ